MFKIYNLNFCLIFLYEIAFAQTFQWTPNNKKAYQLALSTNYQSAKKELHYLSDSINGIDILVENYIDFLKLLIEENRSHYKELYKKESFRLSKIKKLDNSSPYYLLVQAEIKLHWAIINFKFGNEWNAFWRAKQSFFLLKTNAKKFPSFLPNRKYLGAFKILFASIPSHYHWLLKLFGIHPDVYDGLQDMQKAASGGGPLAWEAKILKAFLQIYVLRNYDKPFKELFKLYKEKPQHIGLGFINALAATKAGHTQLAISFLEKINHKTHRLLISYYLLAILYLEHGDYNKSIVSAKHFLTIYKGENYIKDAYYRLFLASWFENLPEWELHLNSIKTKGITRTTLDIHAEKFANYSNLPNKAIMKARLFIDGNILEKAENILTEINIHTLNERDKTDYYYRLARIRHKQKNYRQAEKFYLLTIELQCNENNYFAPNACLQLGYIYRDIYADLEKSKRYLEKVFSYRKHEYKNSLNVKAKMALQKMDL